MLVTRDRAFLPPSVSVTNVPHVHFEDSLKPFFGEMLFAQICNVGNAWPSLQRDLLLGHCILNPQKSDVYVFQFPTAFTTIHSTSCV